ncbi:Rho GTPase activation protein [Fennellomyces sp. T-0311]|nr:Rho GTPase activation protein [Fennellomyces sp. T-0311]
MSNLRKSLRRNFWQNRAQKPPSLASTAEQAISTSSVKSPSQKSPRGDVPALLIRCSQEIQERGLVTEGIFRRSGNTALIEKLLKEFANVDDPLLIDLSSVPIHTLTGLFKRYLQQLSEPVIPQVFQPELLNAYESTPDIQEKVRRIQNACQALPSFHSNLLRFIIQFAHVVSSHANSNKMPAENLSIIFAPTCVRLDGVGQLLSDGVKNKSSPIQTPVKMFRTLSLRKNQSRPPPPRPSLSQATLSCDKLSSTSLNRWKPIFSSKSSQQPAPSMRPTPKYEPHNLLQLGLVKENTRWNKFFQFMIENAPKFCIDSSKQDTLCSSGSSQSLTSPKVRRIKDIFGSMLSMFPDIAEELNITMSPTSSPASRRGPPPLNGPQPNLNPSASAAALPPPQAATPSPSEWSPPIPPLRRTLTIDTSVATTAGTPGSPSRFSGTKCAAIWQHWKEREVEEQQNTVPSLARRNSLRKGSDWLKSISQNVDFATPPVSKRPMSVAFVPSARPNYFLR